MEFNAIRIATGAGLSYTVTTSSVSFTIPVSQDTVSVSPRYIRVLPEAAAYINFGYSSAVSVGTVTGVLVTPNESEVFSVRGFTYFAVIGKVATVVNVTPVEC